MGCLFIFFSYKSNLHSTQTLVSHTKPCLILKKQPGMRKLISEFCMWWNSLPTCTFNLPL